MKVPYRALRPAVGSWTIRENTLASGKMRIYLAILLLPPLVPVFAAVKTALSRGNYSLHTSINKRQSDFVVEEGNLLFITLDRRDGKSGFEFESDGYTKKSSPTLSSFLGDAPYLHVFDDPTNSVATPGTKVITAQIPLWLLSLLLLIPFIFYSVKGRRSQSSSPAAF